MGKISEETQQAVISKRAEKKGRKEIEKKNSVLERLQIEYVPIHSIRPNEYNPNRQSEHDFELLLRSMEEDGFTQPVIANREGIIVDGEHRWRAAQTLGMAEIPVVRVDMSPEQMRISTIRHNRARGSHDIELEAQVLRDLQSLGALDWAQDSLMLSDIEINRLLDEISAPDALADEDFSEAWIPDKFSDEEADLIRNGVQTPQVREGDGVSMAMTTQAIEQQRQRERLIQAAKTEQDRIAAQRESQIYRISLIFSNEEAEVVKAVLGSRPAETLLEMCHERYGRS